MNNLDEVISHTKKVLRDLIQQRKKVSDLGLLFKLLVRNVHNDHLLREGLNLVLKAILVEFLTKSEETFYNS